MTVCNMSIEGGARAGLIAPDETTFAYRQGPPDARRRARPGTWRCDYWKTLQYRRGRAFRQASSCSTPPSCRRSSPGAPRPRTSSRSPASCPTRTRSRTRTSAPPSSARSTIWASSRARRSPTSRSTASSSAPAPTAASRICAPSPRSSRARRSARDVNAMIVPGSGLVKEQAEAEGLDKIFMAAGFDWREPGCSMCLAMNPDQLKPQRALRLDLEPQFRGPPGLQGPHAPGLAGHGGGGGDRRPLRRYPHLRLKTKWPPTGRPRSRS